MEFFFFKYVYQVLLQINFANELLLIIVLMGYFKVLSEYWIMLNIFFMLTQNNLGFKSFTYYRILLLDIWFIYCQKYVQRWNHILICSLNGCLWRDLSEIRWHDKNSTLSPYRICLTLEPLLVSCLVFGMSELTHAANNLSLQFLFHWNISDHCFQLLNK